MATSMKKQKGRERLGLAWMVVMLVVFSSSGCGTQDAGPTVAELAKRQQIREATEAAKPMSFEDRMEGVRSFLNNRNPEAASAALRPLLISDGTHPDVVRLAAKVKAELGDLLGAATMLVESHQNGSQVSVESLFLSAKWFGEAGRYEQASATLNQVLAELAMTPQAPECVYAHRQLAEIFNESGRRHDAAPHLLWLARSGDIREKELYAMMFYGEPFVEAAPKQQSPKSPTIEQSEALSLLRAQRLRQDGELLAATELVESLSVEFPESTSIAAFRGRAYAELHEMEKLARWPSELPGGIQAEPGYWFAMGTLKNHQSQNREAVRCFAEAILRDPTDRFSYRELSRALLILEQEDVAKQAIQKFALLEEATRLANRFGSRPGTEIELNRLAELLHDLGRDAEAIGWRMIKLKRFGGSTSEIDELVKLRRLLGPEGRLPRSEEGRLPRSESDPGELFALCGLRLTDWPKPTLSKPAMFNPTMNVNTPRQRGVNKRPSIEVPIRMVDVAAQIGIGFQFLSGADPSGERALLHQLTGGGIGVIDMDLDGWPDLYFTQAGGNANQATGSAPNQLFRNLAGRRYQNVSSPTQTGDQGYGQGVAVADLNQDGFADLVVANIGPNRIFINQGDGTFEPQRVDAWEAQPCWTTSIACGDLSGDGLPEIVEINYVDDPTAFEVYCEGTGTDCNPSNFKPAMDHVWRVQPNGQLEDGDSLGFGLGDAGYGFAAVIANVDSRSGCDLFVANDRVANDLWLSQVDQLSANTDWAADGVEPSSFQFVEHSQLHGCAAGLLGQTQGCMGIATGDLDRNGKIDFFVTNFWNQPADLYLQRQHGFFVHASTNLGLDEATKKTVAWGAQAVDFDHNGWLDLAVLNGHLVDRHSLAEPYRMPPQLFAGGEDGFELRSPSSSPSSSASSNELGSSYWERPTLGRTMAVLDWNSDGKPDLVCNHLDEPVALLENQTTGGNALQLELVGVDSERDATGAVVTVLCGDQRWTTWVLGGDGFLCSNEAYLDIGIGSNEQIDEVLVQWPSGASQRLAGMRPNHRYLMIENQDAAFDRSR